MSKKSKIPIVDLNRVETISLEKRASKVLFKALGKPCSPAAAKNFFNSLPHFLKADGLRELIGLIAKARQKGLPFHVMMGAHVIKVGLSPILIDLMKSGIITGLSFNSAGLIHDLELSFTGKTSEDVVAGLGDGSFGMSQKTGELFASVVSLAAQNNIGLGEAAGEYINSHKAPYRKYSLFANAYKYDLPATVHIAIGTDIVQQMPMFDAAESARASYHDFKVLSRILIAADRGGVVANVGSAVLLPEVFLKALTIARNLTKQTRKINTANFDMIHQYRPTTNVVHRPTLGAGKGFNFAGHHEIMIPLLAWGLKAFVTKIKK
jgi:hypothetical protein